MVTDAGTAMGQDGQATAEALHGSEAAGIDPERLEICLSVLAEAEELSPNHADSLTLQRATAKLFKAVKVRRRRERRAAEQAADRAVIAKTATGAPDRTDDETRGIPLASSTTDWTAGVFQRARPCYICKQKYRVVHAHYHQLCPTCAEENWARREARADLTGRRALLTGGRAKIGMYIALRLLRDGAHTTVTTRFPKDAVRRFAAMPDSGDWLHRLRVVGLDLRDPAQVIALADSVGEQGPLDILINNAAQTVRRSPGSYARLIEAESAELPSGPLPEMVTFGSVGGRGAVDAIVSGTGERELAGVSSGARQAADPGTSAPLTPEALAELALTSGSATPERIAAGNAIDAGGLVPDLVAENSWTQHVHEVDALEMLEVQLCNVTAPFLLVSRLRPAMAASAARRTYIVNVAAMEGVFGRGYKGAGHPHTNMAKASLNMLTRTSAQEMLESDGILMTSVDTGWITDERPHPDKVRLAEAGFHAPLDLVDGAARVYDPIVRGERGEDLYGCFLKDYKPAAW